MSTKQLIFELVRRWLVCLTTAYPAFSIKHAPIVKVVRKYELSASQVSASSPFLIPPSHSTSFYPTTRGRTAINI